jgi:hypothetical protein
MSGDTFSVDPETLDTLHAIAAHVLGRRRHAVTGRFGLRATPGGFGTPAFGDGPEVVRVAATSLVRELAGDATWMPMDGATLGELAQFCTADLSTGFSVGAETPALPDAHLPLTIDPATVDALARWYALAWTVLDRVTVGLPVSAGPTTIQLWPEHFDAATTLTGPAGGKVNLGFSPGDGYEPQPYAYLGPWDSERPGDAGFWNAPFGAVLRVAELARGDDPAERCLAFFVEGFRRLRGGDR